MSSQLITELYQDSANPNHKLGEKYIDEWGRVFRYVQAGGTDLVTGNLMQEPAEVTNYRSMVVQAASAIGSTNIAVTLGGTAVTASQFESGDLIVESSTGIGQAFKIVSHDVQTGTTGTCNFVVDRPVAIALTTSSQVSVRKNSYDGVIQYPTTPTGGPVGIAIVVISDGNFGWIQSAGDCAALYDTGADFAADESAMIPSRTVAGSVTPDLETIAAGIQIGWAKEQVSVDATMGFVHLTID
ncbi:MAG: hypothetical protein QQN63_07370 [Nitrosopumilus sp.]